MAGTSWVPVYALLIVSLAYAEGHMDVFINRRPFRRPDKEDIGRPLFLTPLLENGRIDEARAKATVQHKQLSDISSYAGYLTINKEYNSNTFFWFFPAMNNPKTAPVILWLQGGPGVSSLYGLFVENGPFIINKNNTLEMRKFSWTMSHSVLYVDNPVGTGFSFTDNEKGYATNETHIGRDVLAAVVQFFKLFPELRGNEFFVTGESYAGKYVPAVSHAIKEYNTKAETKINMKGLAIGNGLTDPENQLLYGDFLYQVGLLDFNGREVFHKYEQKAHELMRQKKFDEAFKLFDELLSGDLIEVPSVFKNLTGYDYYFNILHTKDPTDGGSVTRWVEQPDVRRALHVGNNSFHEYNRTVEEYMKDDVMQSVAHLVSDLLDHYRVMVYNGQLDVIVAYTVTENYLMNLKWSGAEKYKTAPRKVWRVGEDLAGYTKTVDNLTEVMVRNAGHMVPTDQPQWALDMITRFTHNKGF